MSATTSTGGGGTVAGETPFRRLMRESRASLGRAGGHTSLRAARSSEPISMLKAYEKGVPGKLLSMRSAQSKFDDFVGESNTSFLASKKPYFLEKQLKKERSNLRIGVKARLVSQGEQYDEYVKAGKRNARLKELMSEHVINKLTGQTDGGRRLRAQCKPPHRETVQRFAERLRRNNLPSVKHHLDHNPRLLDCRLLKMPRQGRVPEMGVTAFEFAVRTDNTDMAKLMLKYEPNVNLADKCGFVPLYHAISLGNVRIADALFHHGAVLDACDPYGVPHISTAIRDTSGMAKRKILEMLTKDPLVVNLKDQRGRGPLFYAITAGDMMSTRLLLDYESDQSPDNDGVTPFEYAVLSNEVAIVTALLAVQNDHLARHFGLSAETALHLSARLRDPSIASHILGLKPGLAHAVDVEGNTPLHRAAECGTVEVSEALVTHGANMEALNKEGLTALQVAAMGGMKDVVILLHRRGAESKYFEVAPELRAEIEMMGEQGERFSLDASVQPAQPKAVNLLVRHGAYGSALRTRKQAIERISLEVDDVLGHDPRPNSSPVATVSPPRSPLQLTRSTSPLRPQTDSSAGRRTGDLWSPGGTAKGQRGGRGAGRVQTVGRTTALSPSRALAAPAPARPAFRPPGSPKSKMRSITSRGQERPAMSRMSERQELLFRRAQEKEREKNNTAKLAELRRRY